MDAVHSELRETVLSELRETERQNTRIHGRISKSNLPLANCDFE